MHLKMSDTFEVGYEVCNLSLMHVDVILLRLVLSDSSSTLPKSPVF